MTSPSIIHLHPDNETLAKALLRRPEIAWPTVALAVVAMLLYGVSTFMGVQQHWPVAATVLVNSLCASWLFTVAHDASHNSLSLKRWLNDGLERLSDFGPVDDLLTEMVVGLFAKCGVFLVSPMRGLEAHFRHAPLMPPFDAEALGFDRVVHGAPVDKIVMPRALMAASIATRSPVLRAEATRALDDIVRRHGQLRPVSQEAARTIRTLMEQRKLLRADLIAEQMGVSRRTLSRRLEEEGMTRPNSCWMCGWPMPTPCC